MNLSELFPPIHNGYEFVMGFTFLLIQAWQFWVLNGIKKNTNGLVAEKVAAAEGKARSEGMREGTVSEQTRVAAKLKAAEEAMVALERAKSAERQ